VYDFDEKKIGKAIRRMNVDYSSRTLQAGLETCVSLRPRDLARTEAGSAASAIKNAHRGRYRPSLGRPDTDAVNVSLAVFNSIRQQHSDLGASRLR
jgi:hypothetical protein